VRAHSRRFWFGVAGAVLLLVMIGISTGVIPLGQLLRQRVEATLNRNLVGYTVQLPDVHLDLFGLGLRLRDLSVTQDKHPKRPVARIGELAVTMQWGALLHLNLVADLTVDEPMLYIDRRQLQAEAKDEKKVTERGWQQAVQDLHPLDINRVDITDGSITYIDSDKQRPIRLEDVFLVAENIRNYSRDDDPYPSDVQLQTRVFGSGHLRVNGEANFLTEPSASFNVDVDFEEVPLDAIDPVSDNVNLRVRRGILAAEGHVEYAPKKQDVHLEQLRIDGVEVEYLHSERSAAAEAERVEAVKETAKEVTNEAETRIVVDTVQIRNSEMGYTDKSQNYRVFLSKANVTMRNVSSQARPEPANVEADGLFMGVGAAKLNASFKPVNKTPHFDLAISIDKMPLTAMNDILEAYGNFDVVGGDFAFYTEMKARDGQLSGYVKPLLTDVNAFDRRQDSGESILKKAYEGVVGGLTEVLENRQDDVAAKVDVSGPLNNPNVSTLETILSLIRNAIFNAIRPGLENYTPKG
jgi:hypothetical protein